MNLFKVKESTQEIFDKSMKEIRGYQVIQFNLEDRIDELTINDSELKLTTIRDSIKLINNSYTGYSTYYIIYKDLIEEFTKKYGKDFELYYIKTNNKTEAINDLIQLNCVMECMIMLGIADILAQYSQVMYHVNNLDAIFHNKDRILGFIRDIISFTGKIEYKTVKILAQMNELTDFDCEDIENILREFVLFDKNDQKLLIENLKLYRNSLY